MKHSISHRLCLSVSLVITLLLNISFISFASADQLSAVRNTYGIATGDISGESAKNLNSLFEGISRAGFKNIRVDFEWRDIQPNSANSYSWYSHDQIVKYANKYNLKILAILDYSPKWASEPGCNPNAECAPENPLDFANFAKAVAQRYKSTIFEYEIWNEENSDLDWSPAPNAGQYAQLLKDTYPDLKLEQPNAEVILGGMAYKAAPNGYSIDPVTFLSQVYSAGARTYFDAVGYHPYTFPTTALDPNNAWSEIQSNSPSLRSVMISNDDINKKIWITEYGAPTNGPAPNQYVGQTSQAQMVLYAYIAMSNEPWIGQLYWYTYQDAGLSNISSQNFYGLVTVSGAPKPALKVWEQILGT
jgi:hypothetical protein